MGVRGCGVESSGHIAMAGPSLGPCHPCAAYGQLSPVGVQLVLLTLLTCDCTYLLTYSLYLLYLLYLPVGVELVWSRHALREGARAAVTPVPVDRAAEESALAPCAPWLASTGRGETQPFSIRVVVVVPG